MANTTDVPTRIAGRSVEDIASKLYNSLISAHPGSEGRFLLHYPIEELGPLTQGEKRGIEAGSCGEFVEHFKKYDQDCCGSMTVWYREKERYYDQGYVIKGGLRESSEFFSGLGYHRKRLVRTLAWHVKTKITPLKCWKTRVWLTKVIQQASRDINLAKYEPFYITIKHESSRG